MPNPKQRYDIQPLLFAFSIIKEFNALDLTTLDFYNGDTKLNITKEEVEEFRFCCLSNVDFVKCVLLPENGDNTYWKDEDATPPL